MDMNLDLRLSTGVASPAARVWGKPLTGGALKAFFVPSVHFGREVVELLQRMDVEHENVTVDRIWSLNIWGFGDFYHRREPSLISENLERALVSDQAFDVMVIPGVNGWNRFTPRTLDAIRDRVRSGTGLVLIAPFGGASRRSNPVLDELSPLEPLFDGGDFDTEDRNPELDKLVSEPWSARPHYVTRGVPFEVFPYAELAFFPYRLRGEAILESRGGHPVGAVREAGRGRVVAFGWYNRDILPQHKDFTGWDQCYESIVENWHGARTAATFAWWEYFYSLVGRAMTWAARREPAERLGDAVVAADRVTIPLPRGAGHRLEYTIRDEYEAAIASAASKGGEIPLPQTVRRGGSFRVDCRLLGDGGVVDWATVPVLVPRRVAIASIDADRTLVAPGETLSARIEVEGAPEALVFEVVDDFDRVVARERRVAEAARAGSYAWPAAAMGSMHVRVRASLEADGRVVQRVETPRVILKPARRTLDDFEVLICPQNRGVGDLAALEDARLHELGCTVLYLGDNKTFARSGAEKLGFTWKGPEGEAYRRQKESYLRTKDKRHLHRQHCLNGREFISTNTEAIPRVVAANARFSPITYYANDEGSITCYTDELDLCFCPDCMREMRSWLRGEYGTLEKLNETWRSTFASWDEVEPQTYLEARASGRHASWADHRRFMERTFAGAYRMIGDLVRSVDPAGVVSISGTQASNAYSGYDYYLLHQCLGRFEAYRVGNQYELHRSFARPGTIVGGWFGYGVAGDTVHSGIWYALYHGISLISVFWEYACMNPDFTFCKSGADMSRDFHEIRREGIGKLLLFTAKRRNLGIAVHYSMHVVHGTYLRETLARYEQNRDGWLRAMEDVGCQYDMIASQQIEAGELRRRGYEVLVLPYALALSDAESAAIHDFVAAGGRVVGDFQTGLLDEHCRARDAGCLDDVFGIERLASDTQPFYVDEELTLTGAVAAFPDKVYGSPDFKLAEYGTRAGTGVAAYVHDYTRTVPAVVVNRHGRGEGVYLNFSLERYVDQRAFGTGGAQMRAMLRRLFDHFGVVRPAALKTAEGADPGPGYETVYYHDGSADYVAVQRELSGTVRVGHDGLALGGGDAAVEEGERIFVEMASDGHVYDVRRKRYLGFGRQFPVTVRRGDSVILARLPHAVRGLRVEAGEARRGRDLEVHVRIDTDRPDGEHASVLAVSFRDPAGTYRWLYSGNHAVSGREARLAWPIPFNETTGEWTLEVKDVASGVASRLVFTID